MSCPQDEDDPFLPSSMRSPLAPIPVDGLIRIDDDNNKSLSALLHSFSRSHSDDELRHRPSLYQRRKSSVTGLSAPFIPVPYSSIYPFSYRTIARPPYHRRRSHHRRPSPARNSPGLTLPASLTPIHANFNSERRTSLPALHFHESAKNVVPLHTSARKDSISDDIYGGLQTFTFGAPPRHVNQESDESDEDERHRRDRAKMRAIDDGTRRPSLPTNSETPTVSRPQSSLSSLASSNGIIIGDRQWSDHEEPDWDIIMGDITPTKSSPPPPTTSSNSISMATSNQIDSRHPSVPIEVPFLRRRSRSADELAKDFGLQARATTPTPLSGSSPLFSWVENRQETDDHRGSSSSPDANVYDGLNLEYILDPSSAASIAETDLRLQHQTSSGGLRGKFRRHQAKPSRVEDTFINHLDQYDPQYGPRRREWSFRREGRSGGSAGSKSKDKDRTSRASDEQEGWRCEWVGRFSVTKIRNSDKAAAITSSDPPKPVYNRLQIVNIADPSNKGNVAGGPRVLIHRHSRARAFSIFRGHKVPAKVMVPTDSVLLAIKSVLREYTRTESTRALKTHGLTDDGDTRPHRPEHMRVHSERSRSKSRTRPPGHTVNGSGTQAANASEVKKPLLSESSRPAKQSTSPPGSQSPEARSRKDSIRTLTSPSPSASRSASTSRPSSLALFGLSHSSSNSSPSPSNEHVPDVPPVPHWDEQSPTSPRTSTSHAEAFAMRDLDMRDVESYHHHRDELNSIHSHSSVPAHPPPHAAPLPPPATPSPPHGQRSTLGFGERLKRAFGSKQQKDWKEPLSPTPGPEDEDEPKTATQDGRFAPPWLTVVRRSEKEQHERMIRTLNDSFESVGLIPPQDKKKPSKTRPQKYSRDEQCPVFEDVPDDCMCMLLPLWPGETGPSQPLSQTPSRHSGRSARHTATMSSVDPTNPPLQERKFLLVYYVPFDQELPSVNGGAGSNSKKRRRPQTAGERPHHGHHNHVKTPSNPDSFKVVARLLSYNDVRSSGVRLPDKGLSLTGPLNEAAMCIPSHTCTGSQGDDLPPVIAICHGAGNDVELLREGLEKLGLLDPTAPRNSDSNGDATSLRLSAVGRAIVEMVWSGCMSLMTFQ